MRLPAFTAERSLYTGGGHYHHGHAGRHARGSVVPAIPFCDNCDEILDNCDRRGGRPYAVCRACAVGNCFSGVEDPTPEDPFTP